MIGIRLAGVAIVLAATATQSVAQVPLLPKLPRLGLVAGVNVAKMSGEDMSGMSNKAGFDGGAYIAIPVSSRIDIQPELLFSMKGGKFHDEDEDLSIHLNYVEIPVLARFNFPTPGIVTPQLFFGPSIAYRAGCKMSASGGGADVSVGCSEMAEDGDDGFSKFDVGGVAGGGLTFGLGKQRFTVSARYEFGIKNVTTTGDAKNRALSVLAGFEFPLGF